MVTVVVEVARGSFVKRRPAGDIDFISPLPCPYNYGSIEDTLGADGDPLDAIVLGPRLPYGLRVRVMILGFIDFVDADVADPKWVCGIADLRAADRIGVERFFHAYAAFKRVLYTLRHARVGRTACRGWGREES